MNDRKQALEALESLLRDTPRWPHQVELYKTIRKALSEQVDEGDMFWDENDLEVACHSPEEVVENYGVGEIVEIQVAKRLTNKFGVYRTNTDFKMFDSVAEAEQYLAEPPRIVPSKEG